MTSAYQLCVFSDDLTSRFFVPTAPFVSGVMEFEYDGGGGESKPGGKVDIRGEDRDGGGPGCENIRRDGFRTSSRLASFASSTRSWSKSL
jgi:hypothetical protein